MIFIKIRYVTIIFFLTFRSLLFAQSELKTNSEIIKELSIKSVDSILKANQIQSGDTLNIKINSSENTMFLSFSILNFLKDNKNLFLIDTNINSTNWNTLIINIEKIAVDYSKPYREDFIGKKKIVRNIQNIISYRYNTGSIIKDAKSINFNYNDTVNYDLISKLENKNLPITQATVMEDSIFENYAIPIFTITTITIIGYLFFTIRK